MTTEDEVEQMIRRRAGISEVEFRHQLGLPISETERASVTDPAVLRYRQTLGLPLNEAERQRLASSVLPTAADFRSVGLPEEAAKAAAAGVDEGRFISFEDACWSVVGRDEALRTKLDESAMRQAAVRFSRGKSPGERVDEMVRRRAVRGV